MKKTRSARKLLKTGYQIDPLIKATAEALSLPEDIVESVIKHQFSTLEHYMSKPTSSGINLFNLGTFWLRPLKYRERLSSLIDLIRRERKYGSIRHRSEEELTQEFRLFWSNRRRASGYRQYRNKMSKSLQTQIKNHEALQRNNSPNPQEDSGPDLPE